MSDGSVSFTKLVGSGVYVRLVPHIKRTDLLQRGILQGFVDLIFDGTPMRAVTMSTESLHVHFGIKLDTVTGFFSDFILPGNWIEPIESAYMKDTRDYLNSVAELTDLLRS